VTTFERVEYTDPRAIALRATMDEEMEERYGMTHIDPEQVARINAALSVDPATIAATVLAISDGGTPTGHAALRPHGDDGWEVKRVIVLSAARGEGVGQGLMLHLEEIAREAGVTRLILQTGDRQPEAVRLYERIGYLPIPVYAPYDVVLPQSFCFAKAL
jgi:GNAT superfamily N-acetyltransferase